MPPALSDDEASDVADYPEVDMDDETGSPSVVGDDDDDDSPPAPATNGKKTKEEPKIVVDEEDEDGDEDDEEIEEYIVESIKQHMIDETGNIKFQVKWEGYDSKKDLTWEPEENLAETADEILEEYYKAIGGREAAFAESEKAARGKKRGRQSTGARGAAAPAKRSRKNATHPGATSPPATKKWTPPSGSWEDEIEKIDACEEEGSGKLVVYLNWKNGHKTKHETAVIYKKCPQKMLQFYEKHVRYVKQAEAEAGAGAS